MKRLTFSLCILFCCSQLFGDTLLFLLKGYINNNPTPNNNEIIFYEEPKTVSLAGLGSSGYRYNYHKSVSYSISFSGEHYLYVYAMYYNDDGDLVAENDWFKDRDFNSWIVTTSQPVSWRLKELNANCSLNSDYKIDDAGGTWKITISYRELGLIYKFMNEFNLINYISRIEF